MNVTKHPFLLILIDLLDGYKLDHRRQYPEGTTRVFTNNTPRGSRVAGQDKVVFFGLQYFLMQYFGTLAKDFFDTPEEEVIEIYQREVDEYVGPNDMGIQHILELHRYGKIPLRFWALPEGTLTPVRVPMFVYENTQPQFFWVTNFFETLISNVLWMPCTSATIAYMYRTELNAAAVATGGPLGFVQWQGHDFSMRGMAGVEAALMSGGGHQLSFTGTDTKPVIRWLRHFYDAVGLIGGTIPATEHSVVCAGGEGNEYDTLHRLLTEVYPSGPFSYVSDTWDFWGLIRDTIPRLKSVILGRPDTSMGPSKLVIRPDSGDPVKIICGDSEATDPLVRGGLIEALWNIFGGHVNSEGFRELDPHIGAIYGDSITIDRQREIVAGLAAKGFASTNIVLGIGSFTYQHNTRDTFGFALKATWAMINEEEHQIFKDPKTDSGEKKSAKGRIVVHHDEAEGLVMVDNLNLEQWAIGMEEDSCAFNLVFDEGITGPHNTLTSIRNRLHPEIPVSVI